MEKKKAWFLRTKRADFKGLSAQLGVDPLTVRLLVNRDIGPDEMKTCLHPSVSDLCDPHLLRDGDLAASLLLGAVHAGVRIRIIGDYDIDGIESVYILHKALLRVGALADWAIPDRVRDGYGLNPRLVEEAAGDGVGMIITCDNGIAAGEAISLAGKKGMAVIVTDHHDVPYREEGGERVEVLPPADAIINPHREGDRYPFKDLCGAAVAWKLIFLLYEKAGVPKEEAFSFIENAAFATVGDVMPLRRENRAIVKLGLKALARTKDPGMQALFEVTGTTGENLSAFRIGFVLGPCLNAAGRLSSAALGVSLLEAGTVDDAKEIALILQDLNEKRKHMTLEGVENAHILLEEEGDALDPVLVLYEPSLPESVAGIVAGRIREETGHPTIVLTDSGDLVKGSGRSIPAYPMFDRLCEVSSLLTRFGGHPMAAGLSLPGENVEKLREELNKRACLKAEDLVEKVYIDADMPFSYLCSHPALMDEFDLLEPFGTGNEKPLFAERDLKVLSVRTIGKEGQYLKFTLQGQGGYRMEGLYFGDGKALKEKITSAFSEEEWERASRGMGKQITFTAAYQPKRSTFHGTESIDVVLKDILLPEN